MLRLASGKAQESLRKASDAAEMAEQSSDPDTRAFYFGMEANWLRLAASYEIIEKADDFLRSRASDPHRRNKPDGT
jgi:hypothetical protein